MIKNIEHNAKLTGARSVIGLADVS